MEFSIVQWMGGGNNPDSSTKRKRQELFYIWAFPTLQPMGINIFVSLCPVTVPLTQVPTCYVYYLLGTSPKDTKTHQNWLVTYSRHK